MDEKDQKPLTIGDILDQLIKPSVLQGPEVLPQKPATPTPQHIRSADLSISSPHVRDAPLSTSSLEARSPALQQKSQILTGRESTSDINLPRLGKELEKTEAKEKEPHSGIAQLPEFKLYIRTMSADLERLKRGQQPSGLEVRSAITPPPPKKILPPETPSLPPPPKPVQPLRPILPRPVVPLPTRPLSPLPLPVIPSAPQIPSIPPGKEQEHHHTERIISKEDLLPPFLGAPIPKRVIKQKEEKVEYRLIAKIIGSGITVGIISTVVMAIVAYFLISFFVFNRGKPAMPTPVVSPTETTPLTEINELETIFRGISTANFIIPDDRLAIMPALKSFVDSQILIKKEFKRINFISSTNNLPINQNFTGLLDTFSISYPPELKKIINEKYVAFLYGQEELLGESGESIPEKLVFIVEINDTAKIMEIMMGWEATIASDLKEIFNIDPSKEASRTFLDNERRGAKIRYKNFPLPDKSIDYAVLSSLTGKHYLILTNSRESMYSPTDKLQGL